MSLSPCDFQDMVLQAAADFGAPFVPGHDEPFESDDHLRAAQHIGALLKDRADLLAALLRLAVAVDSFTEWRPTSNCELERELNAARDAARLPLAKATGAQS